MFAVIRGIIGERGKQVKKNLRFYSMVAALATVYSVAPGRVIAGTGPCEDCNNADFFLRAYRDDGLYGPRYGDLPISSNDANAVCAGLEEIDGGTFDNPDAYNVCLDVLMNGSDSEWCSGSCETSSTCSTVTCAGTEDCVNQGYNSTCVNGCCGGTSGGGTSGGNDNPTYPNDPYNACSGSEHNFLLVYTTSTVTAGSVYSGKGCGILSGSASQYGVDTSEITQEHCLSLGEEFRIIDWCSQTICNGDIAESTGTVRSCNLCASGYTRVEIGQLFGYDHTSYSTDNWDTWPWVWTNTVSSDEPALHPFYVCVKCEYTGSAPWSSYDSNRVRRYVPVCSANSNTYQYACKADRCATSGSTTSSLNCADRCSFPYTSCPSSDGHWTQCTCQWSNGAYSTDMDGNGTTCAACPTPTNIYSGTSGTTVPGTHALGASGSVNACYVDSGTYHDSIGTWTWRNDCYYKTTVAVGS